MITTNIERIEVLGELARAVFLRPPLGLVEFVEFGGGDPIHVSCLS